MAHKTLINGTQYGIKGGKTLISGTSYSVKNGKTLINGTAYDIKFSIEPGTIDIGTASDSVDVTCIAYGNGYYVAGINTVSNDGSLTINTAAVAITTDPSSDWTIVPLWQNNGSNSKALVNDIIFANNTWVAVGVNQTSSTYKRANFSYSDSPIPFKNMSNGILWSGNGEAKCITYANNHWVAGGYTSLSTRNYAEIVVIDNIANTTNWKYMELWNSTNSRDACVNSIQYVDTFSRWIIGGSYTNSNNDFGVVGTAQATVPSSADDWSYDTDSLVGSHINNLIYVDGNFVAAIDSGGSIAIKYTDNISTSTPKWTYLSALDGKLATNATKIRYVNGYYVLCGTYRDMESTWGVIAYSTSIEGSWTVCKFWNSVLTSSIVNDIIFADNCYVTIGYHSSSSLRIGSVAYAPNISDFNNLYMEVRT